jgi:KaiC/GvpD/RAD55 family RecA-like ATPase
METLKIDTDWIKSVLPEGLPLKTTTVITGPGGSGKPLIGETFVSAWLRNGGSVVFMALQYPSQDFITESIKNVTGIELNQYKDKIFFLQLDTERTDMLEETENIIKANLVIPNVWDKSLDIATSKLPNEGPGILIFGSALNLLLFSPTYEHSILEKIISTININTDYTYIFSVSTSAKADEISKIEDVSDNIITSYSEKEPFRLFFKVNKMKNVTFDSKLVQVPISHNTLNHIKKIADHSRMKVIPAISKL